MYKLEKYKRCLKDTKKETEREMDEVSINQVKLAKFLLDNKDVLRHDDIILIEEQFDLQDKIMDIVEARYSIAKYMLEKGDVDG